MSQTEDDVSNPFLEQLNNKVAQDVPGAKILTESEAIQQDKRKYSHELDEQGSVFPSIPIEQKKHRTKQEKDRFELKQDLKKLDTKKESAFQKIGNEKTKKPTYSKSNLSDNVRKAKKKLNSKPREKNVFERIIPKNDPFDVSLPRNVKQYSEFVRKSNPVRKQSSINSESFSKSKKRQVDKKFELPPYVAKHRVNRGKTRENLFAMDMELGTKYFLQDSKQESKIPELDHSKPHVSSLKQYFTQRDKVAEQFRSHALDQIIRSRIKEYSNENSRAENRSFFDVSL